MLSSSLEEFLIVVYKMALEGSELKSTDIAKQVNVPLQKAIQAIQRLHYQKYLVYSPYQPLVITDRGKEMANFLIARNNLVEEFLEILQINNNRESEKEAMLQYLSKDTLEVIEKFVLFNRQYPEVLNRYKIFLKRKPKVRLLPEVTEPEARS